MRNVLKIKSSDFIDWYFNSGSDQERKFLLLDIGSTIVRQLLNGEVSITPQDILDGCEETILPLNIVEGFEGTDSTMEIQDGIVYGRISEDFKIELV